jgi:hypothetical protein
MRDRRVVFAVPLELPAGERERLGQQPRLADVASEAHGFRHVAHRLDDGPVDAAARLAAKSVATRLAGRVADLGRDHEGVAHGCQTSSILWPQL